MEMPLAAPPPLWLDIPLDLAGLLLARLPAHVDRIRFAAVCRQWRAAAREVPLPLPLPLHVLPDSTVYSLPRREPFHLPACAGYTDAFGNWLLFSGDDGSSFLRDPFSNAMVPLPALHRARLHDMSGETFATVHDDGGATNHQPTAISCLVCSPSSQLVAARVTVGKKSCVAVCRPGVSSRWSACVDDGMPLLSAMAFHDGKLLASHYLRADLYAINVSMDDDGHPWVSGVRRVIQNKLGRCPLSTTATHCARSLGRKEMFYLLESRGALLVVRRGLQISVARQGGRVTFVATGENTFELFKANFEESRWTEMATIGDEQLFLSGRHGRSVGVSQFGVPGDRVVFFLNDDEGCGYLYDEESAFSCSAHGVGGDSSSGKVVDTYLPGVSWKRGTSVRATWLFPKGLDE